MKTVKQNIVNQLKKLDSKKQLTFAYLLCVRLFENYKSFSEFEQFGKPDSDA